MVEEWIDNVDRGILYLLQQDARNNTIANIGEHVGVSSSTVGNRIARMEDRGVITGYHPIIDYGKVGLSHHLLVVGTIPVEAREDATETILQVSGVVNVRLMATNRQNVSIEVVGHTQDEVTDVLDELNETGVTIERTEMIVKQRSKPYDTFGEEYAEDGGDSPS